MSIVLFGEDWENRYCVPSLWIAGLDLLLKQWTLFLRTGSSPETREGGDDLSISTDDISLQVIDSSSFQKHFDYMYQPKPLLSAFLSCPRNTVVYCHQHR